SDGVGIDVKNRVKKYGIKDLIVVDKNKRTGRSVVFLGRSGEKTVLVYRGASQDFKPVEIKKSDIQNTKWLYISSLGGNISTLDKVVKLAMSMDKKLMINPGKRELTDHRPKLLKLLSKANIILLNREEASILAKRAYSNIKGIVSKIAEYCPKSIIIITDGINAVHLGVNNELMYVIIKPVKSVDMTGAGDAFGSGFLAGYIRSKENLNSAINLAIKNSASVVTKIGAKYGLLKKTKLSNKLNYQLKKLK
ncbi:MAG: PfkB family carbohydrate kinase, partial [bacterium]|nr:PfkB family carbohydrate kinase [bacterium]